MRVQVFIEGEGGSPRAPEFSKPEVTLGRRPTNDVVLPDAGASGAHARVFVTGGALTIVDLDSTNGTFVNQRRLHGPHVLSDHDLVEIGDTKLRFTLSGVEGTSIESIPQPPSGPELAISEPIAPSHDMGHDGGGAEGDWPAPPPMVDDMGSSVGPPPPMTPGVPASSPTVQQSSRLAVFPRLSQAAAPKPPPPEPPRQPVARSLPRPPSAAVSTEGGYEFQDAEPEVLLNRVFEAVWRRVSRNVLASDVGAKRSASTALHAALTAASSVRALGDVAGLHARMLAEMVEDGPLTTLLEGKPDEVVFISSARARVNRGGHVSEGKSPFSCPAALAAWVRRSTGVTLGPSTASARGVFGQYAVHAAYAPMGSIVSLRRRTPSGGATADAVTRAGVLSPGMLTLLSACVASRSSVLVCTGPGARGLRLMSALLAGTPPHELQIAFVNPGADLVGLPPGAVAMTRSGAAGHSLQAALGLGPDRIAIEEMEWNEAGIVTSMVSRSFSQILGLRAANASAGLTLFRSMLAQACDHEAAGSLVSRAVGLIVTLQHFSDGVDRVTQLAEPYVDDEGELGVRDVFSLVPGSRTWQFTGVRPQCFDDIVQRGFPLDPSILA